MTDMVFILSLPRSGSTLLQRILSKSDDIATFAEPWLMLPMLCAYDGKMTYSEYGTNLSSLAIKEFVQGSLGEDEYKQELKKFLLSVYGKASGGKRYCLEKTPRYALICEEIYDLFPDSKFIVLTRNPLSICASILSTWSSNRWKMYNYKVDIYKGIFGLSSFLKKTSSKPNVLHIRYEDLVKSGSRADTIQRIKEHLDLSLSIGENEDLSQLQIPGRMGDKTGINKYSGFSDSRADFPSDFLCNPLRRYWAKRYLKQIGRDNLSHLGYSIDELAKDASKSKGYARFLVSDVARMIYGIIYDYFEPAIMRDKFLRLIKKSGKSNVCHR